MRTLQIRQVKAKLSAVVAEAQAGRPTVITRHGEPSAMIVPMDVGRQLYPSDDVSLASHLLAFPGPLDTQRDTAPLRDIDL